MANHSSSPSQMGLESIQIGVPGMKASGKTTTRAPVAAACSIRSTALSRHACWSMSTWSCLDRGDPGGTPSSTVASPVDGRQGVRGSLDGSPGARTVELSRTHAARSGVRSRHAHSTHHRRRRRSRRPRPHRRVRRTRSGRPVAGPRPGDHLRRAVHRVLPARLQRHGRPRGHRHRRPGAQPQPWRPDRLRGHAAAGRGDRRGRRWDVHRDVGRAGRSPDQPQLPGVLPAAATARSSRRDGPPTHP